MDAEERAEDGQWREVVRERIGLALAADTLQSMNDHLGACLVVLQPNLYLPPPATAKQIRQAEQAAREDERRKVLEEAAQIAEKRRDRAMAHKMWPANCMGSIAQTADKLAETYRALAEEVT